MSSAVKDGPLQVVWAYDREHLHHPFIVMGLKSLMAAGHNVAVVSEDHDPNAPYACYPAFSFGRRQANFYTLVHHQRGELEKRAVQEDQQYRKMKRKLSGEPQLRQMPRRIKLHLKGLWHKAAWAAIMARRVMMKAFGHLRQDTVDTWGAYLTGFRWLMKLPADVIVASRPEAAIWACLAAKLRGKRFVYFPFELYGEQIVKGSPLTLFLERLILRRGIDAMLTQNESRAEVYVKERGARVAPLIVHNYKTAFPEERGGRLRSEYGIGPDKKIVLYEGMLIGGRWLEVLAQAIHHLPEDVVMVFMGRQKMKWLTTAAKDLEGPKSTGRFIIAKPASHHDLPDYVADADAGVIIYDDAVRNNYFCEPGKLTDYISVGVPVVAPNFPTIGPVVRERGIGLCFDGHSPHAIAATLQQVLARPKLEWKPALTRACGELTWESQAPNLLAAVTGASGETKQS